MLHRPREELSRRESSTALAPGQGATSICGLGLGCQGQFLAQVFSYSVAAVH